MATQSECRTKHLQKITKEIKSLRDWLTFLERDVEGVTNEKGVIGAIVLTSISESCTSILYNAGIVNGTVLGAYDQPDDAAPLPRPRSKKQKIEETLRQSDLTAQLADRQDIVYGHHDSLPRGKHVANQLRKD